MKKITFEQIGGGCLIEQNNKEENMTSCDAHYKSDSGIEFVVYTNSTGYRYLPEQFVVEKMSEIKQREQESINEAKLNLLRLSSDDK